MVALKKRILVVDDEQIVRDSCQRALTDAGYTVHTVGSGRDALKACRDEPVDVMLTDLRMPDMDGFEVIRAVRKEFPEVRVVIITGYPSRESAAQAAQFGIFDYLEKPLSPARLSRATAAALASPLRHTVTDLPTVEPVCSETQQLEEANPEEVAQAPQPAAPGGGAVNNTARRAVLISTGFLVGVTIAYVIAPVHALAYLAVGTAIASGTVVGLFSDAFFAKSA